MEEVSETPPSIPRRIEKTKKTTSNVWKHFTKIGVDENGYSKAACNGCDTELVHGKNPTNGKYYGTSHLDRHLKGCKDILDSISNSGLEVTSCAKKINQRTHRSILAQAIIRHDLPYSFVEYKWINKWINYLNSDCVMPSRNTVVADIHKIYMKERDKLKETMSRIPNSVCLTSDVWTAVTSESYICLTVHFVDENWKLRSKILNFCRMEPPHTGVELKGVIFDCLRQWGIDKKVFSITLDNASANDSMQNILKNHLRLQGNLLCNGEYFHVRCSAHILNLIVQEGLKVAHEALLKIRESVRFVKMSDGRMVRSKECVKDTGISETIGLKVDVPNRWNSTYLMLDSAIRYERAFSLLREVDKSYNHCPSYEEWRRAEKMCEFLEPFYVTTNLISGSSYPTSNLYFMQVWRIECLLNENLNSHDDLIRDMAHRMHVKFDKYWKDYSVVLAFGAILDPCLKLQFLKYCYNMLDPSTSQDKVKHILVKLKELYGEYAKNLNPFSLSQPQSSHESQTLSKPSEEGSKLKKSRVYSDFKTFQSESNSNTYKSELDFYLDDPQIVVEDNEDFDVLYYWKINETRYPKLSILARDVLSIPITTVASESAFSIGGRVLTKYRSSTLPENVEMLICTRNWLLGFVEDDTDEGNSTSSGNGMSDDEGISRSSSHDAHLTPVEPIVELGTTYY